MSNAVASAFVRPLFDGQDHCNHELIYTSFGDLQNLRANTAFEYSPKSVPRPDRENERKALSRTPRSFGEKQPLILRPYPLELVHHLGFSISLA